MLKKSYSKTGAACRVTFKLPAEAGADQAVLLGDFNDWEGKEMRKLKDGSFSASISLPAGDSYRFRYLLDGQTWENDWAADEYAGNAYGTEDSIVVV